MRHLLFISLIFLFSCGDTAVSKTVLTGPDDFGFTCGHVIYPGDNYDTIEVSGLDNIYTAGQLESITLTLTHPNLDSITVWVYSPAPYNATYSITDVGYTVGLSGSLMDGTQLINTDTLPSIWDGSDPYTGPYNDSDFAYTSTFDNTFIGVPVNGQWVVHVFNWTNTPGHLSSFKLTFSH